MKIIVSLFILVAQIALADTYSYELYREKEAITPIDLRLDVELTGKFNRSSKLKSLKLYGLKNRALPVLILDIPAKDLEAMWVEDEESLNVTMHYGVCPKVTYGPTHLGYTFQLDREYAFSNLNLIETGIERSGFDMSDFWLESKAFIGYLKRK